MGGVQGVKKGSLRVGEGERVKVGTKGEGLRVGKGGRFRVGKRRKA